MIGMAKGFVITIKKALRPSLTVQYPYELVPIAPRSRNSFRLCVDEETGGLKCKACELCAKSCPEHAIAYETEEIEVGGKKRRRLSRFDVDLGRCMFCGICVEQCPSDALENTPDYEFATTDKGTLTRDLLKEAAEQGESKGRAQGGSKSRARGESKAKWGP